MEPDIAFYRDVLDAVPLANVVIKAEKIVYANPAACAMLSIERGKLEGTDPMTLFHAQDHPRVRAALKGGSEGVLPRTVKRCRLLRSDGSVLDVEMEATPLKGQADGGVAVFFRDVMSGQRIEDRLQQVQRMEAIGQLSAGIAHDLNNVLGAMANYLTLLRLHIAPSTEGEGYLKEVRGLVDHGTGLVHQILGFSRSGGGDFTARDLHEVLDPVVGMLRQTLPKRVSIVLEEESLPPSLMDADQIRQVVMNLCINASDAMPQGGKIRVQTARCLISRETAETMEGIEPGPFSRITVSDSGTGMSPETHQRIFEPFFTTKGEKDRSGLGLSICDAVVRGHRGFIDVKSRPGKGTVFSVYLPLFQGVAPEKKPESDEIVEGKGTLLLVDDERTMAESTALLLRDIGFTVLTACSGQEAVEVFSKNADEIQLILMDLGMPGMDGMEAFMKIRELRPGVRALLLTGLPQSDEAQSALREGFVEIVQKPFRLEELSRKIKDAL